MRNLRLAAIGLVSGLIQLTVAVQLLLLSSNVIWANTVAFLVAFPVTLFIHLQVPLRSTNLTLTSFVRRFVASSLIGFALNQAVLLTLLATVGWSEYLALISANAVAAALTLLVSHLWVFRRRR